MPYKSYQTPKRSSRSTRAAAAVEEAENPPADIKEENDEEMADVTKVEPGADGAQDEDHENGNGEHAENGDDDSNKKKPWPLRLKEGGLKKVPKDVQKRRRNFRLKKLIVPKAPVMILHELLGATVQYEVADPIHQAGQLGAMPNMPMLFLARTVYQDTEFVGKGPSKSIAKNICAEQVLQYITTQSCSRPAPAADMDTETAADTADSDAGAGDAAKPNTFETDTPWSALASLAMFKLFNDWQSQGYNLPPELMKGVAAPGPPPDVQTAAAVDKKPKLKKEKVEKTDKTEKTLPENYMSKHPVQLLNEMRGPLEYEEVSREGAAPSFVFTMAVKVEEASYSGQGKSKKEAKKAAAEAAMSALYNVTF